MSSVRFQVMLLPGRELLVSNCSLAEAVEFQRGYHEAVVAGRKRAVIAIARPDTTVAAARMLRRSRSEVPLLRSA